MQEEVFRSVMAFARTGNPENEAIPQWPASENGKESVLILDQHTRVLENHDHALMQALETYSEEITRKMFESMGAVQH